MSSEEVDGTDADESFDEPLNDGKPDALRDMQLAMRPRRPLPLRAAWNGDGETVERIVPSASDGPVTRAEPGEVGQERAAGPAAIDFDGFYLAHRPALLTKLTPFCANDRHLAEDVVQETLFVAYNHRDQLHELDDPAAWLYVVATRVAKKYFKREALREERTREHVASRRAPEVPDQSVLLSDLLHRLLDPQERQVVEDRYLLGHRRQWIADRMGLSLRTVDNRIRTALTKLQRHLVQLEEDES